MGRRITYAVVLLAVVVLLGAQISELFDTWDNTAQTGNDIEFSLTLVAFSVGVGVLCARIFYRLCRTMVPGTHPVVLQQMLRSECAREISCSQVTPSPPPLRV